MSRIRSKKLLILSSFGGCGHIAAAKTLDTILGEEYEIEIIYPIKELRIWGIPSVEESLYNFLLSINCNGVINWLVRNIVSPVFKHREEKTLNLIQKHIEEKRPDLLISLIPFVNYPASEAALRCEIPFLIITTDNDLKNWVFELHKNRNPNFKVTIGHDLPTTKKTLLDHRINQDAIETIGLPLRPDFHSTKSKKQLRVEYAIPENRNVVLIMLGGVGAHSTFRYVKTIAESSLNVHLLVCTGKNRKLAKRIKSIKPVEGNSIDVIPFTDKVHELFGLADLLVTKPGPGTLNEAVFMKLPILIDQTTTSLFWEQANTDLVLEYKVGACIPSFEGLPDLIKRFLYDELTREEVRRAYEKIPRNQFCSRIQQLIEEMCVPVTAGEVFVTTSRSLQDAGNELVSQARKQHSLFQSSEIN